MKRHQMQKSCLCPPFYLKAGYKFSFYWRQTLISPEVVPEESASKAHSIISSHMFTFPQFGRLCFVLSFLHKLIVLC